MRDIIDFEASYQKTREYQCLGCDSKLEWACRYIFGVDAYDSASEERIGTALLAVAASITNKCTEIWQNDGYLYDTFIQAMHLPFFADRTEWGVSIRCPWWKHGGIALDSCGIFTAAGEQVGKITMTTDEWDDFIRQLYAFCMPPAR